MTIAESRAPVVGSGGVVRATNSPSVDLGNGVLSVGQNGVASIGVAALGL